MDKTVKIRAYTGESPDSQSSSSQGNLSDEQNRSFELVKKSALLEAEKNKTLELLGLVEQLRGKLSQEQAKSAELTKRIASIETSELAQKNTQLEEEKRKSHELLKIIEELRESLKQEQSKAAELAKNAISVAEVQQQTQTLSKEAAEMTVGLQAQKSKIIEQQNKLLEQQSKISELEIQLVSKEARVNTLSETLEKISTIAAVYK